MRNIRGIHICTIGIKTGFFLLFGAVPLLLTPLNYELFEFNKMMAVYGLTVCIMCCWITKSILEGRLSLRRTPLDIPILLFVISQLVSTIFSTDPHVSWLGYYSRFNGGMWSVICYVLLYYAFVSNFDSLAPSSTATREESRIMNQESRKDTKDTLTHTPIIHNSRLIGGSPIEATLFILLKISLATGFLVALYGVLERLGIDKHLWVQDVQNRVFSTLGQPNWLAAYLVGLLPIAMAFGTKIQNSKFKIQNFIWILISILFFAVLLFTRSRSGLLGFAIADVIFWALTLVRVKKNIFLPLFIIHASLFIIVILNGTHIDSIDRWMTLSAWKTRLFHNQNIVSTDTTPSPTTQSAPLLEYGGTESGTIRKYVWQAAITAWRATPKNFLIGTGVETFAFTFYQYKPVGHNLTSEWDFLYNKAHNEYLNYLATTGIFGLGSYLLFIFVFIIWFFKIQSAKFKMQSSKLSNENFELNTLHFALFSAWLSILVTNFFGFSVVLLQIMLFLFPAMIITAVDSSPKMLILPLRSGRHAFKTFGIAAVSGIGLLLLIQLSREWQADTLFAAGLRNSRAGQFGQAYPELIQAASINSDEPLYKDELSNVLAGLSIQALENQEASLAGQLLKASIGQSDQAISISPNNVNFWKTRTKIFYAFGSVDPQYLTLATQALEHARTLSPSDPKIYYNLAILSGHLGQTDQAVAHMQKAIDVKPNYRDAYNGLFVFYTELKKPDEARSVLQTYLTTVDPNDKEFLGRIR